MKTNKLFQNSAIVTAVLASLCCITPVLAVLGGLSGIATTFDFLEPLRPYFIAFTAIILGYAFYTAYKPKKETDIDCACEDDEQENNKTKFINSKAFLWTVTVVTAILITFPYYSQVFFPDVEASSAIVSSTYLIKAEMKIEGMTCTGCEQSVDYALKSEEGVINATSSYKTGIAYVEYDQSKINPEQLKKAIEEKVGYKVREIKKVDE
ncbi:MAG: hypothetical protein Kow0098_28240 [Ignavibacteriaceae bacterium]